MHQETQPKTLKVKVVCSPHLKEATLYDVMLLKQAICNFRPNLSDPSKSENHSVTVSTLKNRQRLVVF